MNWKTILTIFKSHEIWKEEQLKGALREAMDSLLKEKFTFDYMAPKGKVKCRIFDEGVYTGLNASTKEIKKRIDKFFKDK